MKLKFIFFFLILTFLIGNVIGQNRAIGIGFYNLENLFDTIIDIDSTKILQADFTPQSKKQWSSKRYYQKIEKLAHVISELGVNKNPNGLAILGVAEIENKAVLIDLISSQKLIDNNYQIVHFDSPDKRGIDVGLLYNPLYFEVVSSNSFIIPDTNLVTRNQLLVSGKLNDSLVHIIVAHWPSRRGGKGKSEFKRIIAARLTVSIIDSLQQHDPAAKIIFMGDLNDNPIDKSTRMIPLNNSFESLYKNRQGSLKYRNQWFLFDQIMLSPSFILESTFIYHPDYLKQAEGNYKGYPNRTYAGNKYLGGYSDHFPVYLFLIL